MDVVAGSINHPIGSVRSPPKGSLETISTLEMSLSLERRAAPTYAPIVKTSKVLATLFGYVIQLTIFNAHSPIQPDPDVPA